MFSTVIFSIVVPLFVDTKFWPTELNVIVFPFPLKCFTFPRSKLPVATIILSANLISLSSFNIACFKSSSVVTSVTVSPGSSGSGGVIGSSPPPGVEVFSLSITSNFPSFIYFSINSSVVVFIKLYLSVIEPSKGISRNSIFTNSFNTALVVGLNPCL